MGYRQPKLTWSAVFFHDQAYMVQIHSYYLNYPVNWKGKKKPSHCPWHSSAIKADAEFVMSLTLRTCHAALQRCGLIMLLKKGKKKQEHLKRWCSHSELKAAGEWFKNPCRNCMLVKWKVMFEAAAAEAPMLTLPEAAAGTQHCSVCPVPHRVSFKVMWILPLSAVSVSIRALKGGICSTDFYNGEWPSIWSHNVPIFP